MNAQSQVVDAFPQGSWSQVMKLLAHMNHQGSQEDVVSNWQPTQSLVEDAVSGAKIAVATCHPALAVAGLPLPVRRGPYRAAGLLL